MAFGSWVGIRIEDPFALATEAAVTSLSKFIADVKSLCGQWPDELRIQARENRDFPGQSVARAALEKSLQAAGLVKGAVTVMPRFGPRRRDFHDRRIVFVSDLKKPQKRSTVLLTGGIDRYLESRYECAVVVHHA